MKTNKLFGFKANLGQILIEPIIAIGVFGVLLAPFISYLGNSARTQIKYRHQAQATHYARAGLELVYNLVANSDWDELKSGLTLPETYRDNGDNPAKLEVGTDQMGRFTREINIDLAKRDSHGNLQETGGNPDENTLKVVAKVIWDERGKEEQVSLETYLINLNL